MNQRVSLDNSVVLGTPTTPIIGSQRSSAAASPNSLKIGPQRTSKTIQKLKLLPEDIDVLENSKTIISHNNIIDKNNSSLSYDKTLDPFNIKINSLPTIPTEDTSVYSQAGQIKETPARIDAERLGKQHRALLPRVTAYCTASSYKSNELYKWLFERKKNHTAPKLVDECIYTPFMFHEDDKIDNSLIRLDEEGGELDVATTRKDLFIFSYGVIVFWGFKEYEEYKFLHYLERFEIEKLLSENVQIEDFNYYITQSYQPRIYNDFITLRDGNNYWVKLSILHAIAQSVKISLFESLVDQTIEDTQDIPYQIAIQGKVDMKRLDIMKSIGELFIIRINVNLHGSVMDSPELMWSEPHLEPVYQATRGYLEINQRVELLNQRLEVIGDLLQMLKEQLGHSNEEYLEVIVIILIAVEVIVSIVNILVDIFTEM